MTLTSLSFYLLVLALLVLYYLVPKRFQWVVLLIGSYAFYAFVCLRYMGFIVVTTLTTYFGARGMDAMTAHMEQTVAAHKQDWEREERKAYKKRCKSRRKALMIAILLLNFGILAVLKYYNFFAESMETLFASVGLTVSLGHIGLLLPLGISFYTFQSMGYVLDVYREKVPAERNVGKLALFVSFFPQIIQGPIGVYDQLAHQLYAEHRYSFDNIRYGAQLILWGFFKKLVIADRAVGMIHTVAGAYTDYAGTVCAAGGDRLRAAALCRLLRRHRHLARRGADVRHHHGRKLPPAVLLAHTHRVLAPLAHLARRLAAQLPVLPVVDLEGVSQLGPPRQAAPRQPYRQGTADGRGLADHVSHHRHLARGKLEIRRLRLLERHGHPRVHAAAAGVGQVVAALHVERKSAWYQVFSMLRTFVVVLIGYYFDIADGFRAAMGMMLKSVTDLHLSQLRPGAVLEALPLTRYDWAVLLFGTVVIFTASVIQERSQRTIREILDEKCLALRWAVLLAGIFAVVLMGVYGPGVQASVFGSR